MQVLLQQCCLGFANCRGCFGELLHAGSIEARRCRLREHHSCLQLPQQVRGASLVLGERGRCNLECRDLSTQTARHRGGWRHCSQCFSISGVASVLGTSNSLTVGGSSILSVNVNLGDESADAIAITGDGTFSNGITTSGDVTLGGAVSDVGTVNSLTVFGNTTLSANVAWVRRAPTLSRCGAETTSSTTSTGRRR